MTSPSTLFPTSFTLPNTVCLPRCPTSTVHIHTSNTQSPRPHLSNRIPHVLPHPQVVTSEGSTVRRLVFSPLVQLDQAPAIIRCIGHPHSHIHSPRHSYHTGKGSTIHRSPVLRYQLISPASTRAHITQRCTMNDQFRGSGLLYIEKKVIAKPNTASFLSHHTTRALKHPRAHPLI